MDKFERVVNFFSEIFHLNLSKEGVGILVAILLIIGPLTYKFFKFLLKKYRAKTLSTDLEPFFYPSEVEKATRRYIPTIGQNINPGNYDNLEDNDPSAIKENLIVHFIKKAFKNREGKTRHYIILADAGMGKTTFMINLYKRYKKMFNWFSLKEKYNIKLLPLRDPGVIDAIEAIKNEARDTILLLDAFDEFDPKKINGPNSMEFLLNKVSRFKIVVITSRTNYFKKSEEEPYKTGIFKAGPNPDEWKFAKFYISPFSDEDVSRYIRKYIPFYKFRKREKAKSLLLNYHDLKFRPMLLSNLWDLLGIPDFHRFNFLIYQFLVEKWIDREVIKVEGRPNYKDELYKFSFELTKYFILNKTLQINIDDMLKLTTKHEIKLETLDVTSRSLLNRNVEDVYKFSHKTIYEYFASCLLFENKVSEQDFNFSSDCKLPQK